MKLEQENVQKEYQWTSADNNKAQQLLAYSFYDGALPLSFVENVEFLKFLNFVCPLFVPPNRKKLAGVLLENSYLQVKGEVEKELQQAKQVPLFIYMSKPKVTLGIDGSSDGSSDPISHIVAMLPDTKITFLLKVQLLFIIYSILGNPT